MKFQFKTAIIESPTGVLTDTDWSRILTRDKMLGVLGVSELTHECLDLNYEINNTNIEALISVSKSFGHTVIYRNLPPDLSPNETNEYTFMYMYAHKLL